MALPDLVPVEDAGLMRMIGSVRKAFVHRFVVEARAGFDDRAPGGAVTRELCGAWDHEGPSAVPHHSTTRVGDERHVLRVVFAAEPGLESRGTTAVLRCRGRRRGGRTGRDNQPLGVGGARTRRRHRGRHGGVRRLAHLVGGDRSPRVAARFGPTRSFSPLDPAEIDPVRARRTTRRGAYPGAVPNLHLAPPMTLGRITDVQRWVLPLAAVGVRSPGHRGVHGRARVGPSDHRLGRGFALLGDRRRVSATSRSSVPPRSCCSCRRSPRCSRRAAALGSRSPSSSSRWPVRRPSSC